MIEVYTDGSAVVKGKYKGYGGIGVVFTVKGEVKDIISEGFNENAKTGQMELMAILKAMQKIKKTENIKIYSDSMYAVNTFRLNWINKWRRQGWVDRKNVELLKELLSEYNKFKENKGSVEFVHVKGHSGNEFNELADQLANYKNFIKN